MAEQFDTEAFYSALNLVRAKRRLPWKDVASQAGINASTLSRIGQGKNPDINGLAALLVWSGLKAEMFIPKTRTSAVETVPEISSIIRRDRSLSQNSARLLENIVITTYETLRNKQEG